MKKLFSNSVLSLVLALAIIPLNTAFATDEATVDNMLKQFQAKGILNKEQAAEARKKLQEISPSQWAQIKEKAKNMQSEGRVPAQETSNSVEAAAGLIDTNGKEFQRTMGDMRKILEVPEGSK